MIPFPSHLPFAELIGARLMRFDGGEAEIHCDPRPELLNSFNVVHGGALMGLLDLAMAFASRSQGHTAATVADSVGFVTIELKTSFMRVAVGPLVTRARVLHGTATLAFCEASMFNAAQEMVAHATGTFKMARAVATSDRKVQKLNGPAAATHGDQR